jgi:glucokinase
MYRIGIDLGGTNIAAGLVNENYQIVRKDSVPTNAQRDPALIVDDIAMLCKKICADEGLELSAIEAVGIASPGIANHDDGVVEYANNLPFRQFPICAMLRERTGIKNVHVENDANAAAWGEAVAGAAKGTKKSVMITLGTGVGGGIIIDGKVFSGFNFAGGELGHTVIEKDGVPCSCGRKGCWEAYSSATALIRMTREKMEECRAAGRETLIEKLVAEKGKVSGKTAFDAMRAGDEAGREVVDKYLSYLAVGLGNMINIFQPEVISLGGGVSNERENLLKPLVPLIRKEQYGGDLVPLTKICIAELGNDAGIIGAAFLGI